MNLIVNILVFMVVVLYVQPNEMFTIPLVLLSIIAFKNLIDILIGLSKKELKEQTKTLFFKGDKGLFIFSFLLYFISSLILFLYHNDALSRIDTPSKTILFSALFLLLIKYPLNFKWWLHTVNIASLLVGLLAIYQLIYLQREVALDHMVKIQSGDIAMSLGVFSLCGAFYFYRIKEYYSVFFSIITGILSIGACFYAEVRGAWVAIPFIVIFIAVKYLKKIKIKSFLYLLALFVFSILILLQTSIFKRVEKRIIQAYDNIENYKKGDKKTSVGIRFELWKSSFYAWTEKPILGWGENITPCRIEQANNKLIITELATNYSKLNAHNEFLEELSKGGLLGFTAFMIFLIVPVMLFYKHKNIKNDKVQFLVHVGIIHVFLVATYCLTQDFTNYASGMLFYMLILVINYSLLKNITDSEKN